MKCTTAGCDKKTEFIQLTIDGEDHYCKDCMASLGGTYRDVQRADSEPEPIKANAS